MKYKIDDYVLTREDRGEWYYKSKIVGIKENQYVVRDLWAIHLKTDDALQELHSKGNSILQEQEVLEKIPLNFVLGNLKKSHPELYL